MEQLGLQLRKERLEQSNLGRYSRQLLYSRAHRSTQWSYATKESFQNQKDETVDHGQPLTRKHIPDHLPVALDNER